MFRLFINDLPFSIESKCQILADHTKLYHPILSLVNAEALQNDIVKLVE